MWLGFSGKRGSGKSTAVDYLVKKYGFKRAEFSEELKRIAKDMFGFTEVDLKIDKKEQPLEHLSSKATPREIMIGLGNFGRYFDEDLWIKKSLYKFNKKDNVAIDGVRFPNEIEYIKKYGGLIVRLERSQKDNPYQGEIDDPSEKAVDSFKFDFTVYTWENINTFTLYKKLDWVMSQIGK